MHIIIVFKKSVERNGSLNVIVKLVTLYETYALGPMDRYVLANNLKTKIIVLTFGKYLLDGHTFDKHNPDEREKSIQKIKLYKNYSENMFIKDDKENNIEDSNNSNRDENFSKIVSIFNFILDYICNNENSLLFKLFFSKEETEFDYLLIFDTMDWNFIKFLFSIINITLSGGNGSYRHKTTFLDKKLIDGLLIITQGDNNKVEHILSNNLLNIEKVTPYYTGAILKEHDEVYLKSQEYKHEFKLHTFADDLDRDPRTGQIYHVPSSRFLKKGNEVILNNHNQTINSCIHLINDWNFTLNGALFKEFIEILTKLNKKQIAYTNANYLPNLKAYSLQIDAITEAGAKNLLQPNKNNTKNNKPTPKEIQKFTNSLKYNSDENCNHENLTIDLQNSLDNLLNKIFDFYADSTDTDTTTIQLYISTLILMYIIISCKNNILHHLNVKPHIKYHTKNNQEKKYLKYTNKSKLIKKNNKNITGYLKKYFENKSDSKITKGARHTKDSPNPGGARHFHTKYNNKYSPPKKPLSRDGVSRGGGRYYGFVTRSYCTFIIKKDVYLDTPYLVKKYSSLPPPTECEKLNNTLKLSNYITDKGIHITRENIFIEHDKNEILSNKSDSTNSSGSYDEGEDEDDNDASNEDETKFSVLNTIKNLIENKLILDPDEEGIECLALNDATNNESINLEDENNDKSINYKNTKSNNKNRNLTRENIQQLIEEYWIENIKKQLIINTDDTNIDSSINHNNKKKISHLRRNFSQILKESCETIRLIETRKKFAKYSNIFLALNDIDYLIIAISIILTHHQKKSNTEIANLIGKSVCFNLYYNDLKKQRKKAYKDIRKSIKKNESNSWTELEIFKEEKLYIGYGQYLPNYKDFIKDKNITSEDFNILGNLYIMSLEISEVIYKKYIETKAYIKFNDKYYVILLKSLITIPSQLPMICQPAPHGYKQYGGFLINKISMDNIITGSIEYENHSITQKKNLYNAINKVNSIKLEINKDLLNYLNNDGKFLIKTLKGMDKQQIKYTLAIAETYKSRYFYLPVNADWRGRMYVQSFFITYQGNELSSSLVQFYEGCILDKNGLEYFLVYGANLYNEFNISKKSFPEKINWTKKNIQNILTMDKEWINKADQKIKFVSYCLVFKKYSENPKSIIKLPLFLDATCNGLQHLAALIKDYDLGSRVNLVQKPDSQGASDIYTSLLDPINNKINNSIDLNKEDIKLKLEINPNLLQVKNLKLNRQNLKPLIMTKPYNATIQGMSDQLIESVIETRHSLKENDPSDNRYYYIFSGIDSDSQVVLNRSSISYVANIVHKEIFILFPELKKIFDFLIQIAEICVKANIPLYWFTPHGVKINQHYIKHYTKNISFKIGKRSETMVILTKTKNGDTVQPNLLKQKQAIIPNVIHSLDAAHLATIINKNKIEIIGIHDCFGTLPNNVGILEKTVREEFINIYLKDDFLKTFYDRTIQSLQDHGIKINLITKKNVTLKQITVQYNPKMGDLGSKNLHKKGKIIELIIPDPPQMGKLDITQIIHAKYMIV